MKVEPEGAGYQNESRTWSTWLSKWK